MTDFWLLALPLLALGAWLSSLPFWRGRPRDNTADNLAMTRQRLAELEHEQDTGLLSEADKSEAAKELKLALVNEQVASPATKTPARWLPLAAIVIALAGSIAAYAYSQQLSRLLQWQEAVERLPELSQRIVLSPDNSITSEELRLFSLGIRTNLIHKPDDPVGWLLLGRLHASLGRLDQALDAFARAHALDPARAGVLYSYAQALASGGDEKRLPQALNLISRYLDMEPKDIGAWALKGIIARQLGNTALANDSFKAAIALAPEDSDMAARLTRQLGPEVAPKTVAKPLATTASPVALQVTVSVAPALQDQLPEEATLFVFAKDASGANPMPAAVVRQALTQLPITLTLSDKDAMLPDYRLSMLSEAEIVARLSLDADVSLKAGEMQGLKRMQLAKGTQAIAITIDRKIP